MNFFRKYKLLVINSLEYLVIIPLSVTVILVLVFPFITVYSLYVIFIEDNYLYIIPLILYIIIVYCLLTEKENYFINSVQKLTINFLFTFYILCYINLLISPLYVIINYLYTLIN
jgi:hypothetical protein